MTANRDRRIWAVAATGEATTRRSTTATRPPFIPVMTEQARPGPDGAHVFLDGEEAIEKMTVGKGLKVNLFASEKEFPELANPVQMAFDTEGPAVGRRLADLPALEAQGEMNDKLLIFEDTDGDGKADKCTVFADDLHCPTGFEFYNGGVLVAQAPDLMFLKDTDGDDKADVRERVLHGLDSADTHHTSNSFALDPGRGALLPGRDVPPHAGRDALRPAGALRQRRRLPLRAADAEVRRLRHLRLRQPARPRLRPLGPGHRRRRHRRRSRTTAPSFSANEVLPGQSTTRPPQARQARTRPCPRHGDPVEPALPGRDAGQPARAQRRSASRASCSTSSARTARVSSRPRSSRSSRRRDPNFRPSDLKIGPDGALYFIDWHNPIIGHMQHNLRDPSRDRTTAASTASPTRAGRCSKPPSIAGEPIEKLLDLLKEPEDRVRYRAKIELSARDTEEVIAATAGRGWRASTRRIRSYEHHMLEGLWVHQWHNVVERGAAQADARVARSRARAAATRVLCYWRDRVAEPAASCSRRWRPTRIPASGSRRSGRPASSRRPRRPRSRWNR